MINEFLFICFLFIVFVIRFLLYFYYKSTSNIGFQLPFFLELIFVYPYIGIMLLGYYWNLQSVLFLYLMIIIFQLGMLPLNALSSKKVPLSLSIKSTFKILCLSVFIYILGIVVTFKNDLVSVDGFSSLFFIANKNAVARYDGILELGILYKLGSLFGFITSLTLGMLLAEKGLKNIKLNLLLLIFYLFLFLDSFFMAARAGLLLQSFCLLSSFYFWKSVFNNGHTFRFSLKIIFILIVSFILLFGFFVLVQGLRGGNENFDLLKIAEHVTVWFFGYLPAFSEWFINYDFFTTTPLLGQATFAGLFDLIGFNQRKSGVYDLIAIGNDRYTNIFTVFRGFVHDFGLFGALVVMLFFGVILTLSFANRAYSHLLRFPSLLIVFLISWSFVISPYIYNTILLSSFLYCLISYFFLLKKI